MEQDHAVVLQLVRPPLFRHNLLITAPTGGAISLSFTSIALQRNATGSVHNVSCPFRLRYESYLNVIISRLGFDSRDPCGFRIQRREDNCTGSSRKTYRLSSRLQSERRYPKRLVINTIRTRIDVIFRVPSKNVN